MLRALEDSRWRRLCRGGCRLWQWGCFGGLWKLLLELLEAAERGGDLEVRRRPWFGFGGGGEWCVCLGL